jgi:hypothetical protein
VIERRRDPACGDRGEAAVGFEQTSGETVGLQQRPNRTETADAIERWGRFIGRALGFMFTALLLANLFFRWLS